MSDFAPLQQYDQGLPGELTTEQEQLRHAQEARETLDKDLLTKEQLEKLPRKISNSHVIEMKSVESIVNGKYCPKCIISTSADTEYITISFQDLKFGVASVMMSKNSFDKFVDKLCLFDNLQSKTKHDTKRELLLDQKS